MGRRRLRGQMDASEYKHVVLGLIFLKYISDAFEERHAELQKEKHADSEDRDEYAGAPLNDTCKEVFTGGISHFKSSHCCGARPLNVVRYTTPMAQEKLQSTFFQQDQAASDPLYSKITHPANRYEGDAYQFTETMWNSCSHIIEPDAPERARKHDFYSVWWELYLAYALSQAGISFVANNARPKVVGKGRPDLLAENPRVWIEAVMPQSGDGPDALTEPDGGGVYSVPLEGITLRLITAIRSKATVIQTYMEEGTISRSDTTVIAVSGGLLPISFRFNGYPVPDPVRAVYGVSYLAMEFDIRSMEQTGTSVQVCGEVLKKSRSPVATDFFLQSESSHVSAVLYSYADCVNYGRVPGSEFILVHNPQARVPLPKNWLPLGRQYSLEGQQLRCDAALGRVSTTPV